MSNDAQMAERHGRVLTELAELGLSLARRLHDKAVAAETIEDAQRIAEAYHRVSRSVRLCVNLEAKLARDRVRLEREGAVAARADHKKDADARKARLKAVVTRHLRAACGEDEAEDMETDLDLLLEAEEKTEDFLAEPIARLIVRICEGLEVEPPEEFMDPPANDTRPPDKAVSPADAPPDEPWRNSG